MIRGSLVLSLLLSGCILSPDYDYHPHYKAYRLEVTAERKGLVNEAPR